MAREVKILLSGFEPFGGLSVNTSQTVVEALLGCEFEGMAVRGGVLPTSYQGAVPALIEMVERHSPDAILMLGVATGTPVLRLEAQAKNCVSTHLADNDDTTPASPLIDSGGSACRVSALDLPRLQWDLSKAGVSAATSDDCGDYVCNYLQHAWFSGPLRLAHSGVVCAPSPCRGWVGQPRSQATIGRQQSAAGSPSYAACGLGLSGLIVGVGLA